MSSINSKSHSCKNPLQSTIHQPLQIRTNKHRCFVFCLGHTSLTCVPGIGKKNKYLLNQSGIDDLSTLYRKYRSFNNIQRFQRWLERDIGFTSYQAKMTTCGIGSKLGDIKEINTGLMPICCPTKEKRNRSIESKDDDTKENKKRKIENIKPEKLSPNQNEVKSPDNTIFTTQPRSSPDKHSSKQKYTTNQTSETKPMKLYSSLIVDEMSRDDTNALDSRKQSHSSLDKNKISSSTSEQLKNSPTSSDTHRTLSTIESSDISEESNSYQQKKISHISSFDEKKTLPHFDLDDRNAISDPSIVPSKSQKLNEIFTLTKQKLQPTLDALQGKKDELLSASKYLPITSIDNEYSAKSKLHSPQSTYPANTDLAYAPIKQKQYQQQMENRPLETTALFNADSSKQSKSDGELLDENDSKTAAAMEQNCFNTLQEKVSQAVSQIMTQAACMVHDKIQPRSINSMSSTKIKLIDNEESQDDLTRKESIPFTTDRLKKISTNRTAPNQHNQKSVESNPTTNKSSESINTKTTNKKKSLSTLSSLSNSNQSINRTPSSIDKIQPTSSNIDRSNDDSGKSKDILMQHDSSLLTKSTPVTVSSPNNHSKKEKSDDPVSQSVKESHVMNTNLSETENSAYQSASSPSTPTPCHALWDNVSNENILFQRKKPNFCSLKKGRTHPNDHNQNHHSSTGLFIDFTRQQYFKDNENLDEHILYIKRIKTLHK